MTTLKRCESFLHRLCFVLATLLVALACGYHLDEMEPRPKTDSILQFSSSTNQYVDVDAKVFILFL